MKNIILVIGEEIRYDAALMSYISRSYEQVFGRIDDLKFLSENDKVLPFALEKMIDSYDFITIFAANSAYAVVGKILSTLSFDSLELKNGETLAPSMARTVAKNSFLLNVRGCSVNVIKALCLQSLPPILQDAPSAGESFYLFDCEYESVKQRLESLAISYKISLTISRPCSFLLLVRASAMKFGALDAFLQSVEKYYESCYIEGGDFMGFVVDRLREIGAKITFAESCTAGLIAAKFGAVAGVSDVFDGSLVSYANEIKNLWLNVGEDTLARYGAVSAQTVGEMLEGALQSSGASFALAVSGIAGPGGGSAQKPVGTVFIGAKEQGGKQIVGEFHLNGDRNYIREQSADIAICLLLKLRSDLFFGRLPSAPARDEI